MEQLGSRVMYKNFWDGFSDKPNINTMMLNTSADQLEALDRREILELLPDYSGLDVADIGAGIGRFTSFLAESARSVIATDFIDSFIEQNRKRNAHFENITYLVSDTTHLQLASGSLGLVFTNWLLMYLTDEEVIDFLRNVLKWLQPDGYLHLRESCSEPSTGRAKSASMHDQTANPTRYRFSSIYVELLRAIRFLDDETGEQWRFHVEWAHSLSTYIEHQSNWRQVRWLARKVPVKDSLATVFCNRFLSFDENRNGVGLNLLGVTDELLADTLKSDDFKKLLAKVSDEWPTEQKKWDYILDGKRSNWTNNLLKTVLATGMLPKASTIFCYNPRRSGFYTSINSHMLSERFACNVWSVETNAFFYRTSLTSANDVKDRRVRVAWNENLEDALNYWQRSTAKKAMLSFRGFISVELFAEVSADSFEKIAGVLDSEAFLITLEPVKDNDDRAVQELISKIKLMEKYFTLVSVTEVTEIAAASMQSHFSMYNYEDIMKPRDMRWVLIHARV